MTVRFPHAVCLVLALAACSRKENAAAGPRPVAIRAAPAVEKDVPIEIRAIGRIVSSQSVQIRPQVPGTLVGARFAEGQVVRKGDVLLEIDRRPYEAALAEAKAKLAQDRVRAQNAREDAARYAELVEKEYVTRQQYESAKANASALLAQVAADEAAVERAELNLAYCTIRAPLSGRTGRLRVDPGNLVSVGAPEPLLTIEQVKPVFAEFSVSERHLASLRARRDAPPAVRIRTGAQGREVEGTLAFVDNAVDPATGTVLLKARFPNEDELLWPGQTVEPRLQVAERTRAIVVPASAVAAGQQGDYAYVVSPERKAQLRMVVVEQMGESEAVIAKGISAGELVVTEGQQKLRPDVLVEILQDDRKQPGDATSAEGPKPEKAAAR
jgi:multidrug efflux system membrane fusion protein